MLIRNVSDHARTIEDATRNVYTDVIDPGDTIEVADEHGTELCKQYAIWGAVRVPKEKEPAKAADKGES